MRKKGEDFNPECGKRLKELLESNGITQAEMAKRIFISQQTISLIVTGKKRLTEDVAFRIVDALPDGQDLLYEWLLCKENYKSTSEKFMWNIADMQREGNLLLQGSLAFFQLSGYTVEVQKPSGDMGLDELFHALKNHVIISKDGQRFVLSNDAMNRLMNCCLELFEVAARNYLKEYS